MLIEDRLIRELPEKSRIELTDQIVIEDLDGTKLGDISSLRALVMTNLIFNTVEDMKAATLRENDVCLTLGYHTINDGGGATYRIVYEPTAIDDRANYHYLYDSDVNRAKFISMDGSVTPEQFGAYGDGTHDDINAITKCIESVNNYRINFIRSHQYKITKMIPIKSQMILDFNKCTIIPFGCSAIGISSSNPIKELTDITIENVKIIMKNAISKECIVFNKSATLVTIRNINISDASNTGINFIAATILNITSCIFHCTNTKDSIYGINITGINDKDYMKNHSINIDNIKFINYGTCIGLPGVSGAFNTNAFIVNISNCTAESNSSLVDTCFLFNGSSTISELRTISITSIITLHIKCLVSNSGNDLINIKDISMHNAETLVYSPAYPSRIMLSGAISLTGTEAYNKFPIFKHISGHLYINTQCIFFDENRYKERDSKNITYPGSLYDGSDIFSYPIKSMSVSGVSVDVQFVRNGIIEITNAGDVITNISGGMKNQVIALKASVDRSINNGSTLFINSAPTATVLNKSKMIYLKCTGPAWVEI